jgi:CBS domain-containing protein
MDLLTGLKQEPVTEMDLSDYCTIDVGTAVRDALAHMQESGCRNALVVREGKLVGIFTDRDVLMKVADNRDALDKSVDELMTPDPITLSKAATAADALALMVRNHIRNVPIVEEDGTVVGNFTHFSVLDFLAEQFPDITLESYPVYPRRFSRRRHGG